MNYPNIRRAALEIVYDNGGFHLHYTSEEQMFRALDKLLASFGLPDENLKDIDDWLGQLSEDDLQTACCGEETEMRALTKDAPLCTNTLLNVIFEEME